MTYDNTIYLSKIKYANNLKGLLSAGGKYFKVYQYILIKSGKRYVSLYIYGLHILIDPSTIVLNTSLKENCYFYVVFHIMVYYCCLYLVLVKKQQLLKKVNQNLFSISP